MNQKAKTIILTVLVLILIGLVAWLNWALNHIEEKVKSTGSKQSNPAAHP